MCSLWLCWFISLVVHLYPPHKINDKYLIIFSPSSQAVSRLVVSSNGFRFRRSNCPFDELNSHGLKFDGVEPKVRRTISFNLSSHAIQFESVIFHVTLNEASLRWTEWLQSIRIKAFDRYGEKPSANRYLDVRSFALASFVNPGTLNSRKLTKASVFGYTVCRRGGIVSFARNLGQSRRGINFTLTSMPSSFQQKLIQ